MRDFKGMKRQRGRNRSGGGGGNGGGGGKQPHNVNRAFDSNGPDNVKIRGHAQHVYEKYQQLARDASASSDRVLAENYLQHAEHYFRLLRQLQPQRPPAEIMGRDAFASGYDIDFEDESALEYDPNQPSPPPAEPAAEAPAEAGQGEGQQNQNNQNGDYRQDRPRDRDFQRDRDRPQGGNFNRDRDRDRPRDDRPRDDRPRDDRPRDDRPPREDRPQRDRDFNRDRDRNRDDRPREDRPPREERPAVAAESAPEYSAQPASLLRSQDGEVSHAPAFLSAPSAAPPADGEVKKARGRPRKKPAESEAASED